MNLLFRFRYPLHWVIYLLGFFAPWNYAIHLDPPGPNAHVWGLLAVNLSQAGMSITGAFNLLLSIGIFFALAGAMLRTWGSAYISPGVVASPQLHTAAGRLLEDGPYRRLRNPLYLGTFLHALALSLLMPRSGAIFTIVCIGGLQVALALAEQRYLLVKFGQAYEAYCALVPAVWPAFRSKLKGTGAHPLWVSAFLSEIALWGVAGSFTVAGWLYNARVLTQCVLVSWGVSLLVRALLPGTSPVPPEPVEAPAP